MVPYVLSKIPQDFKKYVVMSKTRLLGRPQQQMYPPVALNQYTWVNRTHKHLLYMLQGSKKILK